MIRLATIGSGKIVDTFLDAVSKVEGIELTCVYSRTQERALEFAQKHGVEKYYWDMDAMLADDELDCVYLAVPNVFHFPYAKKALLAGKNVICEKPFMTSLAEAKELDEIAEAKGLFVYEAITVIHSPNYPTLKEWVKEIGPIRIVQYNFSRRSSVYDEYLAGNIPNVFKPELHAGTLMDLNIYNIHPVGELFGVPKKATYFANRGVAGIDLSGIAVMEYDGFVCTCTGAKDCTGGGDGIIEGEKGYIYIEEAGNICGTMELRRKDGTVKRMEHDSSINRMIYELADFVKMCETNDRESYRKWMDESLTVMEIMDMLRA